MSPPLDRRLADLIEVWPELPAQVRDKVISMAESPAAREDVDS